MGDQPHKSLCSQANSLRSQPSNMASDAISPLSPTVSPGRVGGGGGTTRRFFARPCRYFPAVSEKKDDTLLTAGKSFASDSGMTFPARERLFGYGGI
jgi:hypothetical protein